MNILQLCPRVPYPPSDGGAIAMVRLQEGLLENGCSLHTLCFNTSRHPVQIDELDPVLVQRTRLTAVPIDNRIRPFEALVSLMKNRSYHLSRFSSRTFTEKLESLLKQEHFDAFILESIYMQEAIPLIRKLSTGPVVLRAHNVEFSIWKGLARTERNPIKKWYIDRLAMQLEREEKRILSKVDGVLAITEEDARTIGSIVPKLPVLVSPTGIQPEKYKWNPAPDPMLVAHIGAMDWQPNLEGVTWFLNEVWPKVTKVVPEARLKLAGKNMPVGMSRYCSKSVSVQGFVDDASEFLYDAGIVIVPLKNGSGMRIKLLEGLALGKAIVTTAVGCEGIPVTNGINALIASDSRAFADALIRLLTDPARQERLRKSARELIAQKFNTSGIGRKLVHFVENLVQKTPLG